MIPGVRRISWEFPDPKGVPLDQVRPIRDEIKTRVGELVGESTKPLLIRRRRR